MNDKIQFGLIVTLILSAQAGKVLFFMPVIPKSSKITWMPLANELGKSSVTSLILKKTADQLLATAPVLYHIAS
jgi:hypothetical protein